jgi:hypothetical protein
MGDDFHGFGECRAYCESIIEMVIIDRDGLSFFSPCPLHLKSRYLEKPAIPGTFSRFVENSYH